MEPTDIYTMFADRVEYHPGREFIRTHSNSITYAEANDEVANYARGLAGADIEQGDVIGVVLDNSPEFIYTILGATRLGAAVACINTEMRGEGLDHLLGRSGTTTVISTSSNLTGLESDLDEASIPKRYVVDGSSDYSALTELGGDSELPEQSVTAPTDLAVLLHTSGTTGLPKWCRLSHGYFLRLGRYVADRFEIVPTDVVFNPLPMYHINPLGYYFFGGLTSGATLGLVDSFSVSRFWEQVRGFGATVVILHMAPKDMILTRTTAADADGHEIRVMFPADREFMDRYRIPKMVTGYGSTEAGGLTHTNKFTHVLKGLPDEEDLSQFAGEPRSDVSIRIVDESGMPVEGTQRGEILVRPDEPGVIFDGYHADPSKTVEAWDGLWFNTGDIGYRDEDRLLHFVGRKKDSISHKGQFVNVDLVESALESHPAVELAVVVGVPDDVVGDRVKATIVLSEEIEATDLISSVESSLAAFMVPEFVEFVDDVPRVEGTEKVDRRAIVERGTDQAWHRED